MTEREKAWFLQGLQLGLNAHMEGRIERPYPDFVINDTQLGPTLTTATQLGGA
jgi:hypothetical protein